MSKIGKQSINIPDSVKVEISENKIVIEGFKGKLEKEFPSEISIDKKGKELIVTFKGLKEKKALWGTWRSHIANMIEGVKDGFEKSLKIEGVGWKASVEGKTLVLKIGFSHPVKIVPPESIVFSVEKNIIKISGIDKEKVGNIAAKIRSIYPPSPYKEKGIYYVDEVVRKKVGKKAVTVVK